MKHRRDFWRRRGVRSQRIEFSAPGTDDCVSSTALLLMGSSCRGGGNAMNQVLLATDIDFVALQDVGQVDLDDAMHAAVAQRND